MIDKEVRLTILRILQDYYNENPCDFLEKGKLINRFQTDIDDKELDTNIKYLNDKGFIKFNHFLGA